MKLSTVTIPFFLVLFVCAAFRVGAEPVLDPYVFNETFEDGSVGAWSSYPPSQDTAYDPTIWIKPIKAEKADNRALYREITPNYNIDYLFGVRKIVSMTVDRSSTLTFRAFIKSNRDVSGVKVQFGFADGTSAEKLVPFSTRESWRDCTVALAEFLGSSQMKKLDAVAFMAVCPNADPENLLRFGIDDVSINGMRESRWEITSPAVHRLDEWNDLIAGVHFAEGGSIVIEGNPPFAAGSAAVTVSRAFTGEDEKLFRMTLSKDTGSWTVKIPLTEQSGVTAGFWRATFIASAKDKKSDTASSSLVFLVKTKNAPAENPRILMNRGDAEKIKAKAADGRMKTVWENLVRRAANARGRYDYNDFNYNLDAYDERYWLPTYDGYITAISAPSSYIRSNAVVYGVTGDAETGDAARNALLKMADWPSYVHPHILNQGQYTYWPVGQKLTDLAIGFDMIADRLSPAERKKVADALYSKGVTEVFKEYVRDNRVSSNTSNWIGDVTSGGMLCALAIMNDKKDEELEPYFTGMLLKLGALIDGCFDTDGGYGEGFSYLNHAMHCMNIALPTIEKMYGVHFPSKLYTCLDEFIYAYDPETKEIADWGDTSTGIGSLSVFTYVITKTRNPYYKWLYDRTPGSDDTDLFMMDDSIPSQSPDNLPKIRLFRDTGTAVFRSGFGHDDFALLFRCGAFFNHQHFDQGSFYLSDRGETFLKEVGRSDYYNDPWYQKMVIQPYGHNCILVNGNNESQSAGDILRDVPAWNQYSEVTDFLTFDGGGFASGKLDPLYKGYFDYLRRSILFIEPRTAILIDELDGAAGAKTAELLFHAPHRDDISVSGSDALVTLPGGTLTIRTVVSPELKAEVMKRPLTLYEFQRENAVTMKARGYLKLTAGLGGSGTAIVNVLSTDNQVLNALNPKKESGVTTLTVNGTSYAINTSAGHPAGAEYTVGTAATDALVYARTSAGYIAMRATKLTVDGKSLFTSDKPVSVSFRDGDVMTFDYDAHDGARLAVALSSKPKIVTLNGEKFRAWDYAKGVLTINLAAGSGTIGVR